MKRELKAALGATALLAGAATVVVGGATSGTAAGVPSSAYGITASGLIPIDPLPYVVSTDGTLKEDSAVGLPVQGLADVGVINASAENDHATASVASVDLTGGLLKNAGLADALAPITDACTQLATALNDTTAQLGGSLTNLIGQIGTVTQPLTGGDLISDPTLLTSLQGLCDTLSNLGDLVNVGAVTAECTGHTGEGKIASLNLLGLPVDLPTGANQSLSSGALGALAPILDVKLNTQTTNADGTFTVTALELDLLGQIQIKVASATCGHVTNDVTPTQVPSAPAPKPIRTDVPVTG
ncbi:hypothetical protein [Nocardioides jiangxiensis]|uniref:Virulence factor Mce family protein n=1 Tax=Nocardioides jiangxiensis TaxID=3064524 RepID=A0ABT9AX89_9ACTN|nr:hypothetical protein [Nocardioides sp. WY-20]MDO7867146.1 hypothetical protein [Nocardioides sp. WY-20]